MIRFSVGAASDVGRRRTVNEDCALVSERVVAVADGMGGHAGGDIASEVAIEALRTAMADPDIDTLAEAVSYANSKVWDRASGSDLRGMGTTLCALAIVSPVAVGETLSDPEAADDGDSDAGGAGGSGSDAPTRLAMTNVGDSRIYVLVDGELERLTEDHSLVEGLIREGRITSEEAALHPHRNVVTRVLGIGETVEIDSWELEARVGDRYVLCSDGLFNEVDEARIAATLRRLADPQEAAHELVALANRGGGRDNITVVVVDIVDDDGSITRTFGDRVVRPHRRGAVADLAGFTAITHGERSSEVADRHTEGSDSGAPDTHGGKDMLAAGPAEEVRSSRRFTWRTGVFVLAVLAVFGVAAGAVAWYGQGGYFVGVDEEGDVAVFEGRPGGLLWFQPSVVESTGLSVDELTPVLRDRVEREPEFASFSEAEAFLANLADQLDVSSRAGSSSTTSTSSPTTTTTADTPP